METIAMSWMADSIIVCGFVMLVAISVGTTLGNIVGTICDKAKKYWQDRHSEE